MAQRVTMGMAYNSERNNIIDNHLSVSDELRALVRNRAARVRKSEYRTPHLAVHTV